MAATKIYWEFLDSEMDRHWKDMNRIEKRCYKAVNRARKRKKNAVNFDYLRGGLFIYVRWSRVDACFVVQIRGRCYDLTGDFVVPSEQSITKNKGATSHQKQIIKYHRSMMGNNMWPAIFHMRQDAHKKKMKETLPDYYVRAIIVSGTRIRSKDVTQEMIDAERERIKIGRLIRN